MPLKYERPSKLYMRELRAVARSAQALRDHLPRVNRLPEGFPQLPVETHCGALVKLPDGTAEGSIATLLTADAELNRVRQQYIPAQADDDDDVGDTAAVERDGDLDIRLKSLLVDIRSAIEHYKRESGESIETEIEAEIVLPPGADVGASSLGNDAEAAGKAISGASAKLREHAVPGSATVEKLERVLTDASAQTESAKGALAAQNPQPTTFEKLGRYLDKTADVLSETGNLLKLGADVADHAIETYQEIKTQIFKSIPAAVRVVGGGMQRIADSIRRYRTGADEFETANKPDPPFDLVEACKLILDGKAPPASWRPHIRELRFDFDYWKKYGEGFSEAFAPLAKRAKALENLSPLKGLTGLQSLSLDGTGVADVSPLKGLTGLQSLSLDGTGVADVSPLKGLTGLQRLWLSGTRIADVSPLKGLTGLQALWLDNTGVADVSALKGLTGLQELWLNDTGVTDVSALSGLTELRHLWIDDDVDVTPLANLPHLTIHGGKRGAAKKPVRPKPARRRTPPQT